MRTREADPLADDEPTEGGCSNSACDRGWVPVATDKDGMFLGNDPTDPTYADRVKHTAVYPCQACDPVRFRQWMNGCFKRNHHPCELCEDRRTRGGKHADH